MRIFLFRTFWGFLWSAIAGKNLLPYPGAYGAKELAYRGAGWFGAISYLLRISYRWFRGPAQVFSCVSRPCLLWFFLLSSLGPRRRPDARLWLGVRLVVLWVCGLTAVTADPLVVPAPSSYYLRLIPNRLSTERKRLGLDAVPTPGWVKGFLSFP